MRDGWSPANKIKQQLGTMFLLMSKCQCCRGKDADRKTVTAVSISAERGHRYRYPVFGRAWLDIAPLYDYPFTVQYCDKTGRPLISTYYMELVKLFTQMVTIHMIHA